MNKKEARVRRARKTRIRIALQHVPAGRLALAPDCGFSQTSRPTSRRKLVAMVEGARIVRRELEGA